jgi:ABC-type phosphate/phosphonate transport system ATPase subunit
MPRVEEGFNGEINLTAYLLLLPSIVLIGPSFGRNSTFLHYLNCQEEPSAGTNEIDKLVSRIIRPASNAAASASSARRPARPSSSSTSSLA